MAVGAAVGQAILSVVTFIVATKTLGIGGRWWFQKDARQGLSRGRDDPMTRDRLLRISGVKKGILLRKTSLGDESGCGRRWSGGDAGGKREGG